jgi:cell division protease FtsH
MIVRRAGCRFFQRWEPLMADNSPGNRGNDKPKRGNARGGPAGDKGPKAPAGGNPNLMSRGMLGWIVLIGLAVLLIFMMSRASDQAADVSWKQFYAMARDGRFAKPVVVENDRLVGELKEPEAAGDAADGRKTAFRSTRISSDTKAMYVHQLQLVGQDTRENPSSGILLTILISWGPIILILLLIYFFVFRSLRNAGGGPGMLGNFGRSKHKVLAKEHSNITLDDVAGIDEAKDEVGEIIEFLKNPKKFQRLGGRVPRGVLLIGSPGCGKTLLAKAVAGEAEVPFFSISGSDFVEMFVGVGASRVRDLFKQAKDSSPCIIFLDEIDAVGRKRGSGFSSGGHDEREQTLNAILVEMDGFDSSDQVIVMAATNRADVLDPALTRPGRFDRSITVPLPDIKGRMEILKVHSRKVKMSPNVDLEKLARGTPMFSGAELAAIINEAAIGATLQGKDFVEQDDLEEARDKVRWGRSRKSQRIEDDEKKVIAYHEAGHAIIMYFDPHSDPLHKVTIIPRGHALGTTFMLPERDRNIHGKLRLLGRMRSTFGGRIAEEMFCGDISSGAAGDIRQATGIARAMVMEYGMSERLGFQRFGPDEALNPWEQPDKMMSNETAQLIDAEVKRLIDQTYAEARDILEEHREQLDALAQALLKYETLSKEEVDKVMRGETLVKSTISDLIDAEKGKSRKTEGVTVRPDNPELDNDTPGTLPAPA